MADQKEMKRRLKVLMQKPENQVCSDCPERQPRWASLIVPPPDLPDSLKIGAFTCLECSGSHRRLGVHITFVRSVNLDAWKEAEVLAMENGGNKKVNAIWEANLQRAGGRKPQLGADLTTRERYIRDKYERRRFFDPQAAIEYQNNEPSFDDIGSKNHGGDFANFDNAQVSDAAKARAEKKKKKGMTRNKSFDASTRAKPSGSAEGATSGLGGAAADRRRAKNQLQQQAAPEPVVDLLDLGGGGGGGSEAAPSTNGAAGAPFADFFSPQATNGVGGLPAAPATAAPTMETPKRRGSRDGSRSRSKTRDQLRTKSKTPDREQTRKNQQQDILNMYNTPASMAGAPGAAGGMNPMNNQVNMMAMMQQMQQMNINGQQQQQQPAMGGMGGMGMPVQPDSGGSKHNSRLAMHQNLMMQQMRQQMQQQQQNMNQMQRMMQQQPGGGGGMNPQMGVMNPQMGMMNPQMMQAMMQANNNNNNMQSGMNNNMNMNMGMNPNMMMGMNPNMMMGMNSNMVMQQQQNKMNQFGGFQQATPNQRQAAAVPEKEDPFAQFGTNAFR